MKRCRMRSFPVQLTKSMGLREFKTTDLGISTSLGVTQKSMAVAVSKGAAILTIPNSNRCCGRLDGLKMAASQKSVGGKADGKGLFERSDNCE